MLWGEEGMMNTKEFRRSLRACADVFFPRLCVVCGTRLALDEQQLCVACLHQLPLVRFSSLTENPMTDRFVGIHSVCKAASCFHYQKGATVNRILFDLKYRDNPQVGFVLGRFMARMLTGRAFFEDIDVILPVPLSHIRRWQRGYNQSEWLARGVATITGLPVCSDAVKRVRNNPTQTRLDRWGRLENVDSIFKLTRNCSVLSGKHLLLIDDVFTTGATILSLCDTLKAVPGTRFSILSLAWAGG